MILSEEAFNMIQSQLARAIARAEKAEAALVALDAAVSERHLPCEDGIVGGCEVCCALRDASDAEVASATDSIMDKNETLYTRLAALRAELETEKRCHALAKSFHDLAIADRNLADHKLAQSERAREKAEAALAAEKRKRRIAQDRLSDRNTEELIAFPVWDESPKGEE